MSWKMKLPFWVEKAPMKPSVIGDPRGRVRLSGGVGSGCSMIREEAAWMPSRLSIRARAQEAVEVRFPAGHQRSDGRRGPFEAGLDSVRAGAGSQDQGRLISEEHVNPRALPHGIDQVSGMAFGASLSGLGIRVQHIED